MNEKDARDDDWVQNTQEALERWAIEKTAFIVADVLSMGLMVWLPMNSIQSF